MKADKYQQIKVVLHNAKLQPNSAMKREQSFLVFSKSEADDKKAELEKSDSFGKDSWVTIEKA